MITVGDGIFQVHRAQLVHQGHYFFTSVTPSPSFEIPYPVGLYVAALPFWDFFPSKLDLLRLLRTVTVVADALVGLGLYAVARRQWNDPRAALLAAGLWPFARAPVNRPHRALARLPRVLDLPPIERRHHPQQTSGLRGRMPRRGILFH